MKTKKILALLVLASFFTGVGVAIAQSIATHAVVGTQSVVSGFAVWAPIGTSNPLPVMVQ